MQFRYISRFYLDAIDIQILLTLFSRLEVDSEL